MDKIRLLNSIYLYETDTFLSPSDIVLNIFDEFMIMTNFVFNEVEKIYVNISSNGVCFIIPMENVPENINLGLVMRYMYAEKAYNVVPSINDQGYLNLNITKA